MSVPSISRLCWRLHKPPYLTNCLHPSLRRTPQPLLPTSRTSRTHSTKSTDDTHHPASTANHATDDSPLAPLLTGNKSWANSTRSKHPDLLPTLSKGQSPRILWLGCSDSRVPETTILGCQPGDIFTHRNIANVISATDLSSLAVIQYAVVYLKVQHIVVCGHSSCGGVAAALGNKRLGAIDAWLMPLRQIRMRAREELAVLGTDKERGARLVELNVKQSVEVVRENPDVIEAAKERGLTVHGLVYDLESGELKVVDCEDEEGAAKGRADAFTIA